MTHSQPPLRRASRAARSLSVTRRTDRPSERPAPLAKSSRPARKRFVDARRGPEASVKSSLRPRMASPRVRSERLLAELCRGLACDSAVLLVLDEATSTLLVRAQAGLPRLVTIRPLAEATADLEALCGHAVVLENDRAVRQWQPPTECRAAVCVPVSTADCPLGVLWLFADEPRAFGDQDVNQVEIAATRLARVWAKESPVAVGLLASPATVAVGSSPSAVAASVLSVPARAAEPPRAEGTGGNAQAFLAASSYGDFEIASWSQGEGLGPIGEWIDLGSGRLAMAIGESLCGNRSLATACLRGSLRVHAHEIPQAGKLMDRLNSTLADLFAGEGLAAHLFLATLDLGTGLFGYSLAGEMLSLRMRPSGWHSIAEPSVPLGLDPSARYPGYWMALEPGETLALVTAGDFGATSQTKRTEEALAKWLSLVGWQSASDLAVGMAMQLPRKHAGRVEDRAVLIVKRR